MLISSASLSLSSPSSYSSETVSARIASIPPSRNRVRILQCFWSSSCCHSSPRRPPHLWDSCSSVWGIWMRRAGRRRRGSDLLGKVMRHQRRGGRSPLVSGRRLGLPPPPRACSVSGFQHQKPGQQPRLWWQERLRPAAPCPWKRENDLGCFSLPHLLLPLPALT